MNYLVVISVNMPYPKKFEYRIKASNMATAVSRALRKLRKDLPHLKLTKVALTADRLSKII